MARKHGVSKTIAENEATAIRYVEWLIFNGRAAPIPEVSEEQKLDVKYRYAELYKQDSFWVRVEMRPEVYWEYRNGRRWRPRKVGFVLGVPGRWCNETFTSVETIHTIELPHWDHEPFCIDLSKEAAACLK